MSGVKRPCIFPGCSWLTADPRDDCGRHTPAEWRLATRRGYTIHDVLEAFETADARIRQQEHARQFGRFDGPDHLGNQWRPNR